eukprot:scaffold135741_cov41-Prasinocladus_malaysianus.AAC.1
MACTAKVSPIQAAGRFESRAASFRPARSARLGFAAPPGRYATRQRQLKPLRSVEDDEAMGGEWSATWNLKSYEVWALCIPSAKTAKEVNAYYNLWWS